MTLNPDNPTAAKRRHSGFTLAEVLAALLFLAIVIPVTLQGLRVASMAGEVGQRKMIAARIGNKVLNELKSRANCRTPAKAASCRNTA